jgi:hypothetical protein
MSLVVTGATACDLGAIALTSLSDVFGCILLESFGFPRLHRQEIKISSEGELAFLLRAIET